MFRLTLLSLFAFGSLAAAVPLPYGKNNRIVGGDNTTIEHFPYQVSLILFDSHYCGGSLIAKNWVLTAAHCVKNILTTVRAGSSNKDAGGTIYTAKKQYMHPKYRKPDYDIALLELNEEVTLSDRVQLIKLPESGEDLPVGTVLNVTGWGATSRLGDGSEILQVVNVPVVSREACGEAYGYNKITDRMFCAGYLGIGGKDACQGDSGGPVVANGVQYGVVSWGKGCAQPQYPGVYANVINLRPWIKEVSGV